MRRPLLGLAVAFGLGCLLTDGQGTPLEGLLLVCTAAVALALGLRAGPGRVSRAALLAAAVALGAAAGLAESLALEAGTLRAGLTSGKLPEGVPHRLTGTLRGDAELRDGRLGFVLDVEAQGAHGRERPATGRVRVEVGGNASKPRLADADRVELWATLRPTESLADGIVAFGHCKSARLVARLEDAAGHGLRGRAAALRARALGVLERTLPPGTERGLVRAMVLGDRSEIDAATEEAFKASGTYHVLALSGAQVALLGALVAAALRRCRAGPWVEAVLTSTAIFAYAGFVGAGVPVTRAALVAALVLAARALELDADARNLLGAALIALLALAPSSARDVGLQLSFGATLGILALVGPLTLGVPRLPLRLELLLAASVAAQCAIAPLLAGHFHRLAPAAVLLNLAAVPLSSAVLLAGFAVLALAPLGLGGPAGTLAWIAARALRASGDLGPFAPWLDVRVPAPTFAVLALGAAGLGLLARGRRFGGLAALAGAHALLALGPSAPAADGRLHLTVVDVGQGDALVLRSPSGRVIVVDAGGSRDGRFDPGERRVAPALWRAGVRRVDALVATHAHPDHVGGMPFLLRAFRVDAAWEGPAAPLDPSWRRFARGLDAAFVPRVALARGARFDWGGIGLAVLGPPPPPGPPPPRLRNEDSLVLLVTHGAVRLLLAGDATAAAETGLVAHPVDVVKVAHHGSRTSSSPAFVAAARPRLAIVSLGARNPFGHPDAQVVERYARAGALVLRTDRDGDVTVSTDGTRVWVKVSGEEHERRIR